jgi:two-component system response regulator LytT
MHQFQPIKTVIIDDEMSAIKLLEEMMNKLEGVEVKGFAQDINEGVKQVLRHRPEIIFLDIKLKEESGFDLIQRLKDYDVDPFIVIVTGFEEFGLEALKAGVFDYLLKPLDPDELMKVISRYRKKKNRFADDCT